MSKTCILDICFYIVFAVTVSQECKIKNGKRKDKKTDSIINCGINGTCLSYKCTAHAWWN